MTIIPTIIITAIQVQKGLEPNIKAITLYQLRFKIVNKKAEITFGFLHSYHQHFCLSKL